MTFYRTKGHRRYRVIAVRDCAYCHEKDSVIVSTDCKTHERRGRQFCSRKCARRSAEENGAKLNRAIGRAIRDLLASPTMASAKKVYLRGYSAGHYAGKKIGASAERRRLLRLAIQARRMKEAA